MVVSRAEAVRVEHRGQIQEILKKLALLNLMHIGSSLGNWIVGAATHQSRDPQDKERPNRTLE